MSDTVPTNQASDAGVSELEAASAHPDSGLGRHPSTGQNHRLRAIAATLLIVLGQLLTPVAIIGGWSTVVLTDTDAFVATYAPLAHDPQVQAYITDQVLVAVEQQVDLEGIVGDMVDGLVDVIQRPRAAAAIPLLVETAVQGVRSRVREATAEVVGSDSFATVWEQSLRASHAGLIAAVSGDPDSIVTVTDQGLGLRIGPIVERVRDSLVADGFALATRIPVIDKTVVIVPREELAKAGVAYAITVALGAWLPLVALVLVVGGVVVAVRRHLAALWAAFGVGLGGLVILVGLAIGRRAAPLALSGVMPTDVVLRFYDATFAAVSDIAAATLILAIVVAAVSWLDGPFAPARQLRAVTAGAHESLTGRADQWGMSTGGWGRWLFAQRVWLRIGVAVASSWALLANRPLSVSTTLDAAAAALLALLILWLLARRHDDEAVDPTGDATVDPREPGQLRTDA